MRPTLEAIELDIDGARIAGIRHRDPVAATQRMLCLHGWLDNAASFVPLMPHLPGVDLVAVDLPGHGHSDHPPRSDRLGYTLFDLALTVRRIISALDWDSCVLAGHSMGGCVAPVVAVAAPDAIERLIMIEASGPMTEPADALPQRLVKAFDDRLAPGRFSSRTFGNADEAIDARLKATTMERTCARLIIDRQLIAAEGGWRWRFDPALRFASPQYQTEEQVRAVLGSITVPVLTVIAGSGFLAKRDETEPRLACLKERSSLTLPGHHHVHMDAPDPVATAINRFLGTRPALGD